MPPIQPRRCRWEPEGSEKRSGGAGRSEAGGGWRRMAAAGVSGRAPSWLREGRERGRGRGGGKKGGRGGLPALQAAGRGRYGGRGGSGGALRERGGGGWAARWRMAPDWGRPPLCFLLLLLLPARTGPDPLRPSVPAKWRLSACPRPALYRQPPAPDWAAAPVTSPPRPHPPRRGLIGRKPPWRGSLIGRPPRRSHPAALPRPSALPPGARRRRLLLARAAIRCAVIGCRVT